jgi:hypothetical protein
MTPLSLNSPHWCMIAHSSDMQDMSQHMIPRHLQDTAFPLYHHHYSSTPLGITPDSSASCLKDAEGLIPAYMHLPGITSSIHCNALPQTQHYDALGMPTHLLLQHRDCSLTTSASRTRYRPSFPYPRTPITPFWIYWTTALSAELNSDNPDPTPTPCLARLYCTAFSYQTTPLQYQSFNCIPGMVPGRRGLSLFLEALFRVVGWSSL